LRDISIPVRHLGGREGAEDRAGIVLAVLTSMGNPTRSTTIDRGRRLVAALGLLTLAGCGTSNDSAYEREIWNSNSAAIEFTLNGPAGPICEFSATRAELSSAQLEGLSSLRLQEPVAASVACDGLSYAVTVHAGDGSSARYAATLPVCSSSPLLLFEDFEAWARSTPCSGQSSP
jgi:hypothetical protein